MRKCPFVTLTGHCELSEDTPVRCDDHDYCPVWLRIISWLEELGVNNNLR